MPAEEREKFTAKRRETYLDHDRDELVAEFQANNHAIEAIITIEEPLGSRHPHPQLIANDMVATVDDPELGTTTQIGVPIHLLGTPARSRVRSRSPASTTARSSGELGYSDAEIAAFSGEVA